MLTEEEEAKWRKASLLAVVLLYSAMAVTVALVAVVMTIIGAWWGE